MCIRNKGRGETKEEMEGKSEKCFEGSRPEHAGSCKASIGQSKLERCRLQGMTCC